jgi:acyl-coenzyme A thioesterase PaaI-like protein
VTTGRDIVRAIRREEHPAPPGIITLGLDRAHRWITRLGDGEADLSWTFDAAYTDDGGALLSSWTAAVADQALFFAGMTLCADGQRTRTSSLAVSCLADIYAGPVSIRARVQGRSGDRMAGTCALVVPDGSTAALVTAVLDVVPS